jgi:hypothetical protein
MWGVVGAVDTLRVSETREVMVEGFLGVESPSFLSFLNNWLLVLLMLLTKLPTRPCFRDGDVLGSISGLEWFEWFMFGLNPDISGDGDGRWDVEGEENGDDMFFMIFLTELTLSRLRRGEGAGSSSGLKNMIGLEGLPFSGGRCFGVGGGETKGDAMVFTKLFTRSRVREGEPECSGCVS